MWPACQQVRLGVWCGVVMGCCCWVQFWAACALWWLGPKAVPGWGAAGAVVCCCGPASWGHSMCVGFVRAVARDALPPDQRAAALACRLEEACCQGQGPTQAAARQARAAQHAGQAEELVRCGTGRRAGTLPVGHVQAAGAAWRRGVEGSTHQGCGPTLPSSPIRTHPRPPTLAPCATRAAWAAWCAGATAAASASTLAPTLSRMCRRGPGH